MSGAALPDPDAGVGETRRALREAVDPPAPGRLRTFDFPDVASDRLDNGLDLRVARMPRLPLVTVSLVLPASEAVLPVERAGLATVAAHALEGGAGELGGLELAAELERLGTSLRVSTGWDATSLSLTCVAERLEEAVALLGEVVRRPSFPEDEVERTRSQWLARARQRRMEPSSLAGEEAARLIYAAGVPYARPSSGTVASLEALGRDDVLAFARARYRPAGGGLAFVGDVLPGDGRALVDRHLGDWTGGKERGGGEAETGSRDFDALPRTVEREVHVVHRPGAVQSEIRVGHVGVKRSTDDYFPLLVANTILGGSFTSRLNLNLREAHGYTYGVRSRFAFRRSAGPFSVSTAVDTDVTTAAVSEIMDELTALVTGGLEDEEVAAARDYIAGVFPLQLETTGQVAGRIAELVVYGLPDDWHAHYRDRVRAVDRPTAEAAVRRHVRPEEVQVVVVGDAERVRAPLEALGLGPVHVHAPDEAFA